MRKYILGIALLLMSSFVFAQSDADIQKAKEAAKQMGYSDSQINNALQNSSNNTIQTPTVTNNTPTDRGTTATQVEIVTSPKTETSDIYGHEIFSSKMLNFIPNFNIPTPSNYILSAGDEVIIDIWGNTAINYDLTIVPDGSINIPNIGPVYLVGQTIEQAEKTLKRKFGQIYSGLYGNSGTNIKVSLGKMRSLTVNVVGDVSVPGTYTLPSLSTLCGAIYTAGGVSRIGSVREIKLYRNSKVVANFDVYDYLLTGNLSQNIRLKDNDLIIVEPYKTVVQIAGSVRRPMKYEIKGKQTLQDVINYAGGFDNNAYTNNITVDRKKDENGEMKAVFTVPSSNFKSFVLEDGDVIIVNGNQDRFANKVSIEGAVNFPGEYALSNNIKSVSQLIITAGGLRENAYLSEAYINRYDDNLQPVTFTFSLEDIVNHSKDIQLQHDDKVIIKAIDNFLKDYPISIVGEVNSPIRNDKYIEGMTLGALLLRANGLTDAASLHNITINRRIINQAAKSVPDTVAEIIDVDLSENKDGYNIPLKPYDIVSIKRSPAYVPLQVVTVTGEVNFPGTYVIENKTVRLSDVISKANGLTDDAYINGASIFRYPSSIDSIRKEKRKNLELKLALLQQDSSTIKYNDILNKNFPNIISINLQKALNNPGSIEDIILKNEDIISIPKESDIVSVSGAVAFPTNMVYDPSMSWKDYINKAGGFSNYAKKNKSIIVYMNGSMTTRHNNFVVEPGCEIFVPTKEIKNKKQNAMTPAQWISISTSTISLTAVIISLMKILQQ